ncbi:uncharacterized protein LOC112342589 isoform X2 [Selaginella moellendorffii]|uniref:uncharacterized protein LOC112342589 isoform X1 n=1 Tax=Selaginella moellendorffii TaxID=88036 RepID=UPI000D1C8851|nr:uncharacterized protein LOC112342589 isoform X1 [Selaginella moellendorffii]XP_024520416.1 uncharacterized protein LOC112342589 isoform X2 [Selaginella moellendorffii]|eukprot:XP_024520415.1 uncharacterized protein LOC112342589 isoform X1 [Selaginella moellendorffii]
MFARAAKLAREKARHPHCPPDQAKAWALALVEFLGDFKGHTVDDLWARAEERGIRSRSHMRQLLYWMRQERLVSVEAPVAGSRVRYFRLLRDPERADHVVRVSSSLRSNISKFRNGSRLFDL